MAFCMHQARYHTHVIIPVDDMDRVIAPYEMKRYVTLIAED